MKLTDKINTLSLSKLPHTWILDLDGTIVKHNGYKLDGKDSLLEGAKEFLASIDENDQIFFFTSRSDEMSECTEAFLKNHHIGYKGILYNIPYGERIVINDNKPSGLEMAIAVEKERDSSIHLKIITDK